MKKKELLGLFPQELAEELRPLGLPAFRSAQIFQWLHRGAGFADMTNLPKALRTQLEESFVDQPVSILEKRVSAYLCAIITDIRYVCPHRWDVEWAVLFVQVPWAVVCAVSRQLKCLGRYTVPIHWLKNMCPI